MFFVFFKDGGSCHFLLSLARALSLSFLSFQPKKNSFSPSSPAFGGSYASHITRMLSPPRKGSL